MERTEVIDTLNEAFDKLKEAIELLRIANDLLRIADADGYALRMLANYVLPAIACATDGDHGYLDSSITLGEVIEHLTTEN